MSPSLVILALALAAAEVPPVGTPLLTPEPILSPVPLPGDHDAVLVPAVEVSPIVVNAPVREVQATEVSSPDVSSGGDVHSVARPPDARDPDALPWFGAQLDAGVPDGFGASVAFRPIWFARLTAGLLTNSASTGLRAGLTLVPFRAFVTPTLSGELGHYFDGNMGSLIGLAMNQPLLKSSVLGRGSYDFGNAQLGVELGSPRSVVLYLRAGLSYVNATFEGNAQTTPTTSFNPGTVHLKLVMPSAKLGLVFYFG